MITIVTVNWNSYDFLALLIESIERFSFTACELIVVDNSTNSRTMSAPNVHQFLMPNNIGHGKGLNFGVRKAYELFPYHSFLMFLDVDCHFLAHSWDAYFLGLMKSYDIVGGRGVPAKPIRPACMFMRKELGNYDWSDTPGYRGHRATPTGYDVAIRAYYQIMAENHRIGFIDSVPNRYGTANGEEWCIDGIPLVYHHWHGSHLKERQVDFPDVDLAADKDKLFSSIQWRLP